MDLESGLGPPRLQNSLDSMLFRKTTIETVFYHRVKPECQIDTLINLSELLVDLPLVAFVCIVVHCRPIKSLLESPRLFSFKLDDESHPSIEIRLPTSEFWKSATRAHVLSPRPVVSSILCLLSQLCLR